MITAIGNTVDNTEAAAGVIQSTQTLMRRLSTYTALGWDFQCETTNGSANTWGIQYSQDYPKLTAFGFTQTCVAEVAFVSGSDQRELVGAPVPLSPTVIVRDGSGQPIQGVEVSYAVTAGGGSVSPAQVITAADGLAAPTSWTLGATPGINTLTASVVGFDAITFSNEGTACPVGMVGDGAATACQVTSWRELNAVRQELSHRCVLTQSLTPDSDEYATFAGPSAYSNQGWTPIAISPRFSGHFNGQNYAIDGLTMNNPAAAGGLFSEVAGATIENLTLSNVNLTASSVGGVGFQIIGSTIRNVRVTGNMQAGARAGGIAAFIAGSISTLNQVGFEGTIQTAWTIPGYELGDLVGRVEGELILRNSYAIGAIGNATAGQAIGGLIGSMNTSPSTVIKRTYSAVSVSGTNSSLGAVIGSLRMTGGTYSQNLWNSTEAALSNAIGTNINAFAPADDGMTESTSAAMKLSETYTALGWDFQCEHTNGTSQVWGIIPGTDFPRLRSHGFVQDCDLNTAFPGPHIGWRMLGAPAQGVTYAQLLSGVWTQGFPGAKFAGGSPNVYWFDETTGTFRAPANVSNIVGSGVNTGFNNAARGFIAYLFEDDNLDGTPDGWPKAFNIQGPTFIGDVEATFTETDLDAELYGRHLAANPYPFPIRWTSLVAANALDNMIPVIFVQDPNVNSGMGGYRVHYGYDILGLPAPSRTAASSRPSKASGYARRAVVAPGASRSGNPLKPRAERFTPKPLRPRTWPSRFREKGKRPRRFFRWSLRERKPPRPFRCPCARPVFDLDSSATMPRIPTSSARFPCKRASPAPFRWPFRRYGVAPTRSPYTCPRRFVMGSRYNSTTSKPDRCIDSRAENRMCLPTPLRRGRVRLRRRQPR